MDSTLVNVQAIRGQLARSIHPRDWSWLFWFLVPLYPYSKRRTLRQEVVQDTIWTFDQIQGILYTVVPIRMTVVRLEAGGLLVYAPIAPTQECVQLVRELEAEQGEVRYILLPTASGLEHKVFVGPFARHFPNAQVFVTPNQWSYPLNLPLTWLGFPQKRTRVLPNDSTAAPFALEFDYAMLNINLGRGSFGEVALFHKRSHTLLVTDTVLSVPAKPPAIVQLDPYPLLFHARDSALEVIENSEASRRKGWQRTALFTIYFQPDALEIIKLGQAVGDVFKAPDHSKKAYFGLFPFKWKAGWEQSFDALRGNGRPFVAPILQNFIFDHAPRDVIAWADRVAGWDFQRIIPCHFDAPIEVSPQQFRQAFAVLEEQPLNEPLFGSGSQPLPKADVEFIRKLEENLDRRGITSPPSVTASGR